MMKTLARVKKLKAKKPNKPIKDADKLSASQTEEKRGIYLEEIVPPFLFILKQDLSE